MLRSAAFGNGFFPILLRACPIVLAAAPAEVKTGENNSTPVSHSDV